MAHDRSPAPATRVRVATWNCFGAISDFRGFLVNRPRWPARFLHPSLRSAFQAFDIVCIQENFVPYVTDALEDVASAHGMHLWHDRHEAHATSRSPVGAGLAILSRHRLTRFEFTAFDGPAAGMDAYAAKGIVSALLELPDGARLRIVNSHLQSDDPFEPVARCRAVREHQLHCFNALLDGVTPTIVCGDFNIEAGSAEYHETLAPLMERHRLQDHANKPTLLTFDPVTNEMLRAADPDARPSRLDYVFTAPGANAMWRVQEEPQLVLHRPLDMSLRGGRGRAFASDHYGIGMTLDLVPKRAHDDVGLEASLAATA